jgi:hypothetical protein
MPRKVHMLDRRWEKPGEIGSQADCGQWARRPENVTMDIARVTCGFCQRIYPSWSKRGDIRIAPGRS